MSRRLVLLVASGAVVIALAAPGRANATTLPTTISSNQTWTAAASPYTGTSVTINSGATVTVEAGAVIKLTGSLVVNGTLNAQGTAANPISLTSLKDDSIGGDTNGDGSTTQPARGDWGGVYLKTGTSVLDHTAVLWARLGFLGRHHHR